MRPPCLPIAALAAALFAVATPAHANAVRNGEQVVAIQCVLCHGPGVGGAPRIGDRNAWNARVKVGLDGLVRSAARGRGGMPPSGGLADLSEAELRAAIAYMLRRSGVDAAE